MSGNPTIICKSHAWGVAGLVLLLGACATVSEPDEQPLGRTGPAVSPSLADPGKYRLKRKVAIARFSNETTYGKSVLLDGTGDLVAKQASDILSARLTEAKAFLLFERSDTEVLLNALNQRDFTDLNLPADYLIVGSVTEFGRETTGATGVFSRTKKQRAYAKVNIRLIDVRTGRAVFAQEGAGEAFSEVGTVLGVGTKAGYDSTLNDKAISAAISKVVGNVIENIASRGWHSYVLSAEGGDVIIGGGKLQGIKPGDRFVVVARGKQIENPQTGGIVELPGRQVAELEVVESFGDSIDNEASRCKVVSGTAPTGDLSTFVVREPDPEGSAEKGGR